ncbi:MAG TPA: hypothetical protein PK762_04110, partial [Candidatus Kapabacteria bacterium]|nr:hypothetical protein [Candidatus Kapabacteria bacterium]
MTGSHPMTTKFIFQKVNIFFKFTSDNPYLADMDYLSTKQGVATPCLKRISPASLNREVRKVSYLTRCSSECER